tara:strand:+ start:1596 stop:1889 length:294 start_codon:yes stop_codon:yes gene_type:complete
MEKVFEIWINKKDDYEKLSVKDANIRMREYMMKVITKSFANKDEMKLLKGDLTVFYNDNDVTIQDIDEKKRDMVVDDDNFYRNIYKELNNLKFNNMN